MFTGIVEEVGTVGAIEPRQAGARIQVRCRLVLEGSALGSSILVNGVCLTASELHPNGFSADISPETLRRSTLGALRPGAPLNLERPLQASGRLGGHIVQGHVDGTGQVVELRSLGGENWWLTLRCPEELDRYFVLKGSVAIDGISLTIAETGGGLLSVTVIPHTYENTNLRARRPGDAVNLECDILAKYVEKMLGLQQRPQQLTEQRLRELGY